MSYLEKAKRALDAQAAISPARCSRCLGLDALGVVVLGCSCGYATHPSRPERTAEGREVARLALRASRRPVRGRGRLHLVEGRGDG
jgi:hypothetical protein